MSVINSWKSLNIKTMKIVKGDCKKVSRLQKETKVLLLHLGADR